MSPFRRSLPTPRRKKLHLRMPPKIRPRHLRSLPIQPKPNPPLLNRTMLPPKKNLPASQTLTMLLPTRT